MLRFSPLTQPPRHKGRGTQSNASGRFEGIRIEPPDEAPPPREDFEGDEPLLRTRFFADHSRTILTENKSPDLGFRYSMNIYRGCEHGCAYCYARPTHEYLGLSAGLDFETKIYVKENAPELLRERLMSDSWEPECIVMSGVTDCYQPAERKYRLTRRCLEVLLEFKNPVSLITKNALVTRDIDVLSALARERLCSVCLSVTSLDPELARDLEPRTSSPAARLDAVAQLARAGIPVAVNIAPVIPGLNDHEIPRILSAAWDAGARGAGYVPLRLPHSVSQIFEQWLVEQRPLSKDKILGLIRGMRGGRLNDPSFGTRMQGTGKWAHNLAQMFDLFAARCGFSDAKNDALFALRTDLFQRPGEQLRFF